jgi:multidrug efflux pump subunit AcrA (membrane-fusion protein)
MCGARAEPNRWHWIDILHDGREERLMPGRRSWVVNGVLVLGVALLAYFGLTSLFHKASAHAALRTATVQTGTVSQSVTASGNISPARSENVSFGTGGTVNAVNVTVGQTVDAGATLATLDTGPAQAALTAAQDQLTAAQDNLASAEGGGETPPQVQQDDSALAADQAAVAAAQTKLTEAQTQLASDQAACKKPSAGKATTSPTTQASSPCPAATTDQQAVNQAQSSLTQAQSALAQENLSIEARRYVNPANVLQDEAQVTSAQESMTLDEKTLGETTLTAPFAGTVTAVNGTVGETVSGGGNSSASSAANSSSANSSSNSSSSSSGFLTLADLGNLQVIAGFPEASAVKVKVGQPATVTLSATNVVVTGAVTAVNPTPSVVSNVVTYNVTVSLRNPPASVVNGMSTTVAVVVASAENALELPSSAVTRTGRVSTVELLKNGKQVLTPVTTGLVGDTDTQILAGLTAGEQVVEPSITVSGTGTGTRGSTTGGFGGGAGGAFGGFGVTVGGGRGG